MPCASQAQRLPLIQTLETSPDFSPSLEMFKARQPDLVKDVPAHGKDVG